jgi:hypothetical protein
LGSLPVGIYALSNICPQRVSAERHFAVGRIEDKGIYVLHIAMK